MPIIKSAIKALRQSKKRQERNSNQKRVLKTALKKADTKKDFPKVQSTIDKTAKAGLIHKNKAARLKSRISKKLKNK